MNLLTFLCVVALFTAVYILINHIIFRIVLRYNENKCIDGDNYLLKDPHSIRCYDRMRRLKRNEWPLTIFLPFYAFFKFVMVPVMNIVLYCWERGTNKANNIIDSIVDKLMEKQNELTTGD